MVHYLRERHKHRYIEKNDVRRFGRSVYSESKLVDTYIYFLYEFLSIDRGGNHYILGKYAL